MTPATTPPRRAFRDGHALALLALAVAFFFRRILLGHAFLWEDFLFEAYPFRHFAATSLSHGDIPLWNPYSFAGMPFLADIQSAVFYLPNLLLTPFVRGGSLSFYALEVEVLAHYVVAAWGMYYLARECAIERIYATFAGLAFALSGFMIAHAIHPGFVEEAAWMPWIVWALRRAINRQSLRYALVTGVLAGHAILAGAPQMSLYIFMLVALYAGAAVAVGMRRTGVAAAVRATGLALVAVAVALGVAAIQLLPTLELGPLSQRDTLSFESAQTGRLAWEQVITAIMPKFFGVQGALEKSYWGPGGYGSYWETAFYWGIPALLAAAFAVWHLRRRPLVLALAGVALLAFLLALGDQFVLHRIFFAVVPGFSTFRAPARILILATLAVALLSGMGLQAIVERARDSPRTVERAVFGALFAAVALLVMVRSGVFFRSAPDLASADRSMREGWIALAVLGAAAAVLLLLARRIVAPAAAVAAVLLLQLADITRFGDDQNAGTQDAESFYHSRPEIRDLIGQIHNAAARQLFRITSRDGDVVMFDRNQGMVDALYQTEGYTPLRLRRVLPPAATMERTLDLLNSKYRVSADTVANSIRMRGVPTYLARVMLVLRDTVIADDSAAAAYLRRPEFDPQRQVVLAEGVPAFLASGAADTPAPVPQFTLEYYRANAFRIGVTAPSAGILLLSEIWYPGWRAEVDGVEQPIVRADLSLRAVPVSAGTHAVSMQFKPRSFRTGAWITLATLLLVVAAWFGGPEGRRRVSGGTPAV